MKNSALTYPSDTAVLMKRVICPVKKGLKHAQHAIADIVEHIRGVGWWRGHPFETPETNTKTLYGGGHDWLRLHA